LSGTSCIHHLRSLRTSDVKYLQESFVFYDAIRVRQYFRDPTDKTYLSLAALLHYCPFVHPTQFLVDDKEAPLLCALHCRLLASGPEKYRQRTSESPFCAFFFSILLILHYYAIMMDFVSYS
jgi:hypothetical protein